jgi:hypothetical protein
LFKVKAAITILNTVKFRTRTHIEERLQEARRGQKNWKGGRPWVKK